MKEFQPFSPGDMLYVDVGDEIALWSRTPEGFVSGFLLAKLKLETMLVIEASHNYFYCFVLVGERLGFVRYDVLKRLAS
jgi:hypothetical protein